MSIYDHYVPTQKDIVAKDEVRKPVARSKKIIDLEFRKCESVQKRKPGYISPDLRRRYMSLGGSVNQPFRDLRF